MKWPARFLPDGLAGRFALLLICALLAANLVALGLLTFERARLDRAARQEREIDRIVAVLPAIESAEPKARRAIAQGASTRFLRLSVDQRASVKDAAQTARAVALMQELSAALDGHEVRAFFYKPPYRSYSAGEARREVLSVSIRLITPEAGTEQWLNVLSRRGLPHAGGFPQELLLLVLGLSLVSVLGIGLIFVRRLTQPLAALATAARAAGQGDRNARVPEIGAREMREAAAAFNDMQERIARFDAERMRTLAAVGHDLRTPITSLRIRAEMLDEDEGAPMVRTLDEMTVMANGLVAYAKGATDSEAVETIDLSALLQRLCEERGASLTTGQQARTRGRPVALGRVFGNLIDNAIRYGGNAAVTLDIDAGEAIVTVVDNGPGIPPERLLTVFEPFVRGEASRNLDTGGAGLGLAIARQIVATHGGRITLENRPEGGLCAEVRLALA